MKNLQEYRVNNIIYIIYILILQFSCRQRNQNHSSVLSKRISVLPHLYLIPIHELFFRDSVCDIFDVVFFVFFQIVQVFVSGFISAQNVPLAHTTLQELVRRLVLFHALQQSVRVLGEASSAVAELTVVSGYLGVHGVDPVVLHHQSLDRLEVRPVVLTQQVQFVEELNLHRVERIDERFH